MARAYSQDLRDRVIDSALGGSPTAAQFEIGIATAIVWVRRARASGERTARCQGQPLRSELDPQRDFLLRLVEQTPEMVVISEDTIPSVYWLLQPPKLDRQVLLGGTQQSEASSHGEDEVFMFMLYKLYTWGVYPLDKSKRSAAGVVSRLWKKLSRGTPSGV